MGVRAHEKLRTALGTGDIGRVPLDRSLVWGGALTRLPDPHSPPVCHENCSVINQVTVDPSALVGAVSRKNQHVAIGFASSLSDVDLCIRFYPRQFSTRK